MRLVSGDVSVGPALNAIFQNILRDLDVVSSDTDVRIFPPGLILHGSFSKPGETGSYTSLPRSGTITRIEIGQVEISDINWDLDAFLDMTERGRLGDFEPFADLINASGSLIVEASTNGSLYGIGNLYDTMTYVTVPVEFHGSGDNERFMGGSGDDYINPGASLRFSDQINISEGNDTLDFRDVDEESVVDLYFDAVDVHTVNINGVTNSARIRGVDSNTEIRGVSQILEAWSFGINESAFSTDFSVTLADEQFIFISGAEGVDSYDITYRSFSTVLLVFAFGEEEYATDGIRVDIGRGLVLNDGFGNRETISRTGEGWLGIYGSIHNDRLIGGDENEYFALYSGRDTVDGGDGFDLLRYDRSRMGDVTVDLAQGTATGTYDDESFRHDITSIEFLLGSEEGDNDFKGTSVSERLITFDGNDTVFAEGGRDTVVTGAGRDMVRAGLGADSVEGGAGRDTLGGGGGRDTIRGGEGNDLIEGSAGSDSLFGDEGKDTIRGGEGGDTISGDAGGDVLYGQGGDDLLRGGEGNDVIVGGGGADTIEGGVGRDRISGNEGADWLYGEEDEDLIAGGDGADRLFGARGADDLRGEMGNDTLRGQGGDDALAGGSGADLLMGGDNADTLLGGPGSDTLIGQAGPDLMLGGNGADRFEFDLGDGRDQIQNLVSEDVLAISFALAAGRNAAQIAGLATMDGRDAVIDFGGGDRLLLVGFDDLSALGAMIELF